jgi:DNA gyrase/topoisomerase IV subunit A
MNLITIAVLFVLGYVGLPILIKLTMYQTTKGITKLAKSETEARYKQAKVTWQKDCYALYTQVQTEFKLLMLSKRLSRQQILTFKKIINDILGENINMYQGEYIDRRGNKKSFKFENDAHEIYIKLKCHFLTKRDYENMLVYLKGIQEEIA